MVDFKRAGGLESFEEMQERLSKEAAQAVDDENETESMHSDPMDNSAFADKSARTNISIKKQKKLKAIAHQKKMQQRIFDARKQAMSAQQKNNKKNDLDKR